MTVAKKVSAPASVSAAGTGEVRFTTKGQVVIPVALRRQFGIEAGTRAVVEVTAEGILLRPVGEKTIRRGRGMLARRAGEPALSEEWAAHRRREREIEERSERRAR